MNFREELSNVKEEKSKREEKKRIEEGKTRKINEEIRISKITKAVESVLEQVLRYYDDRVDLSIFSKGLKFIFYAQGMYLCGCEDGYMLLSFHQFLDSYDDADFALNYLKSKFKDEGYEITEERKNAFKVIIKT